MTSPQGTRVYRIVRWLVVHQLAFALRHGLSDAEALEALRRAFPRRAGDVRWRLDLVDAADMVNVAKTWKDMKL